MGNIISPIALVYKECMSFVEVLFFAIKVTFIYNFD